LEFGEIKIDTTNEFNPIKKVSMEKLAKIKNIYGNGGFGAKTSFNQYAKSRMA